MTNLAVCQSIKIVCCPYPRLSFGVPLQSVFICTYNACFHSNFIPVCTVCSMYISYVRWSTKRELYTKSSLYCWFSCRSHDFAPPPPPPQGGTDKRNQTIVPPPPAAPFVLQGHACIIMSFGSKSFHGCLNKVSYVHST